MNDNKQLSEILDSFQFIAETMAKGKPKKVKKAEFQEGFKVLGAQIFPNMEIPFTEAELKSVGVEFISEWIASNWQLLNENEKKVFWKKLSGSFGTKKSCRRFFVVLSYTFLSVDKASAIIPLSILFKQNINGANDFPLNRDIISWIRSLFFKKNVFNRLPLHPSVPEAEQIALYSIACAFVSKDKDNLDLSWQFAVMKWVCSSGLKFQLPDYLMQYVQNSRLSQDKVSADVQCFLPGFPNTIVFGIEPTKVESANSGVSTISKETKPEKNDKKQYQLLITPPSMETKIDNKLKEKHHEDPNRSTIVKKKKITPSIALKALQQYVEESGSEIKEQTQEIKRISIENENLKKKNSTIYDKKSDLEDKLDFVKDQLTQSQDHSKTLQTKIHSLETELADAKQKTHEIQSEIECLKLLVESEKENYDEELKRLSAKISISSNVKEEELLNILSYSLQKEYGHLLRIRNMEMSVQNGEKIRALLEKVFSNLKNAGLHF